MSNPIKISIIISFEGKLGLSQCPGKNLLKGRDGKVHSRNIFEDLRNFKERGVGLIVCLLNDYELRTIGVSISDYKDSADKLGISFIQYPIIEMGSPDSIESLEFNVLVPITEAISQGQFVVVHCRGGVGRAGTIAACVQKKTGVFSDYKKAISFLRKKRDKRCVESRNQEDFVKSYFASYISNKV